MSHVLARFAMRLAAQVMPPARHTWTRAMRAELAHLETGLGAFVFAFGCLIGALRARVEATAGGVFAVMAYCAAVMGLSLFHLACALDGVRVLRGGVDPFYESLIRAWPGSQAIAARWQSQYLEVTLLFAALGMANLLGVLCAVRQQSFAFLCAIAITAAIAIGQACVVGNALGFSSGLRLFITVMLGQAVLSLLILRFAINPSRKDPTR